MKIQFIYILIIILFSCSPGEIKESPSLPMGEIKVAGKAEKLNLIDKELKKDRDNVELLLRKSELLVETENWRAVDSTLNLLLKEDPGNRDALYLNAKAEYNLGEVESAMNTAEKLFVDNYQQVDLNVLLFNIYRDKKELLKALDQINIAVEKNPSNPEYYYRRATCYLQLNDTVKGLRNLDNAFSLGYSDTEFLNRYMVLLIEMNREDEAVDILKEALEIYPEDVELQYTYAYLLDRTRNSDEAKQILLEIGGMDPEFLKARSLLAGIYYRNRQYDSVFVMTRSIQKIDPGFLDAYFIEAKTNRLLGRHYEALALYNKILDRDPNNPIALEEAEEVRNYLAYRQRQKEKEEYENRLQLPAIKPKSIDK